MCSSIAKEICLILLSFYFSGSRRSKSGGTCCPREYCVYSISVCHLWIWSTANGKGKFFTNNTILIYYRYARFNTTALQLDNSVFKDFPANKVLDSVFPFVHPDVLMTALRINVMYPGQKISCLMSSAQDCTGLYTSLYLHND